MKQSVLSLHRQRGVALLIVLWMSVLLTAVAGGFAYNSRIESIATRSAINDVLAIEAARAGLELTINQIQRREIELRPWADGRPYKIRFEKLELIIRIQDESGKIAINRASQNQLKELYASVGLEEEKALALADATLDFMDVDNLIRIQGAEADDYLAAGYLHSPKNTAIITLEELLQVYGMEYATYQKVAPALTAYGNQKRPDLRLAPEAVLRTVPDMTDEFINDYLIERFDQTSNTKLLPAWPDGRQLTAYAGRGPIFSITIDVILPNKVEKRFKGVVNTRNSNGHLPYELLVWAEFH
ncbi:MAG: general secretion pathway protein K [Candidatus Endobugula sp.]|jgi:general secretion pathway protein K